MIFLKHICIAETSNAQVISIVAKVDWVEKYMNNYVKDKNYFAEAFQSEISSKLTTINMFLSNGNLMVF